MSDTGSLNLLLQIIAIGLKCPYHGALIYIKGFTEKTLKIVLTKTTIPRGLVIGMQHHLIVLYQMYLSFGPETENSPAMKVTYQFTLTNIEIIRDHKA